jgi:transcription antitermination factor NusG
MKWLAFRVTTGKEYDIRNKIKEVDPVAEVWIPRRNYIDIVDHKAKEKTERMLPGYVLIGSENGINPLLVSGFIKLIGEVNEDEIAILKAQEGQKKAVYETGSRILVIEGPFQGCKGNILAEIGGAFSCRLVFQGIDIKTSLRKDFISILSGS